METLLNFKVDLSSRKLIFNLRSFLKFCKKCNKIASIILKLFIMKYGVLRVKFHQLYSGVSNVCYVNLQWTIVKYDNKGILNFIMNRKKFF